MNTIMQQTQTQDQQQAVLPPMRFPLSVVPASKATADIKHITGNFKDMDYKYVQTLLTNLMAQASRWMYETVGYIPAPPATMPKSREIIKQVIGKDGCYFKKTTENCGIDFIYYDQEHEVFMFWGPSHFTVTNAMKIIRSRICRTISKEFPRPIAPAPIALVETKEYMRFDEFMALNADNEPFNPNETRETVIYDLYDINEKDEGAVDPTDLFARLSALEIITGDKYYDKYGVVCVSNMDCPCFDCSPCHGACDSDCNRPKLN